MIPYTVDRRADTGVNNVTLGIWLFIASEVMLFGALFSAYALLRVSATEWPHGRDVLNLTFASVNTLLLMPIALLIAKSRTLGAAAVRRLLLVSSLLAIGFLAVKAVEYAGELRAGLVPATNTFLALYFTLTGLHAIHVLAGVVANLWAAASASRIDARMLAGRAHALTIYWAFVDFIWLVLLVLLYLS